MFYFTLGTVSEIVIINLAVGGLYALLDYFQAPQFLMKYKIQSGKNAPPDTKKLMKVLLFSKRNAFNLVIS